jgi:LuxR family transcriptional regulator, quorum-sensing system regulator CciR
MPCAIIEELAADISSADTTDQLHAVMIRVRERLQFDHFAIAYDHRTMSENRSVFLIHDYPEPWAKTYVEFDLAGTDPVRRACERTMTGFAWRDLDRIVPLTNGDHRMMSVSGANGIANGYTVPRHLPGHASGSCTFALRPDKIMPMDQLGAAEILGALALASAKQIAGTLPTDPRPVLSQRQRECVLWSARGKTAGETAAILGIAEDTVVQHLKVARERYDVHSRHALILCSLFDGLISFGDIFRWWYFQ